ncbi:unnamed protein product [Nippostrongylus brasiliensis]|uniref:DLH domain-containing protein n=1 Tax=Nippostrongylus brasiliensis TaxID=27835 RepID=A0A0N4XH77_NIPBR|nr:unnamed protein product [Nippostrongylus brasiliensis]
MIRREQFCRLFSRNMAAGDKKPGVLVLHTFAGCGDYENSRAASLSKLGFIVLAADLYGKGNRGSTRQECAAFMRPLMADRVVLLKKRLDAAVEALRAVPEVDTERVGFSIGYCFGGLCALDLARRNTDGLLAAVSFHGTLTPLPDDEPRKITASVQIHHGDADPHIPVADFMDEMRARNADWSFTSHGNAVHGFTQPRKIFSM